MLAWSVVFLAIFLIGVTKSGFGSGVGLMIVPMTALAMDFIPGRGSEAALGLLLPLLIFGDIIAVWQYRRLFSSQNLHPDATAPRPRHILARLLPGTLAGVVLGGLLLWWFHQQQQIVGALIRIEIGIESILLVGIHWWRTWRGVQRNLFPEPLRSHLTGAFAAVSSTLAHAAGPIVAMYLLPLNLNRQLFVGLCAAYFFALNSAKLPAYYFSNQFVHAELPFTLRFTPLVVAGALFGFWINKRLSDKLFTTIVYAITFALGWYILIDGVVKLVGIRHAGT